MSYEQYDDEHLVGILRNENVSRKRKHAQELRNAAAERIRSLNEQQHKLCEALETSLDLTKLTIERVCDRDDAINEIFLAACESRLDDDEVKAICRSIPSIQLWDGERTEVILDAETLAMYAIKSNEAGVTVGEYIFNIEKYALQELEEKEDG